MDGKLFGAAQERQVPLREIDPDRGVQMREGFDARKATQYGERYREGVKLPPVVLFYDGVVYHRADGAHRIMGAMQADLGMIDALVYEGGRREALLYAAGANADFGLDRTDETIRTSILTLLRDGEWYEWSDRAIARHVTCSHTTVAKLRRQVDEERAAAAKPAPAQPGLFDAPAELVTERDPEEPRVRRGADGRKINTSKIGAGKKQEQEEQRLRELLAGARELGAQDAAKGLRSQGELVRALGACPPGKLEILWAAYRAALEEARGKARTFQPASEATEALRGKPIGGPPLVLSASNEVEKEDPAEEDEAEEEDEEALCRICGKEVCEDEEACLARAEEEDGEDLDEDGDEDGAEEAPRATALSVLGGLVRNLTSDPARKDEVGAELLRLAAELGAQPEGLPAYELRQALAGRNAAERERERSEERERALHRRLFDLAAAWRRQGQDGPRADLVAILDGGAEDVAVVLGRSEPRRALPWKAVARALRQRWLRAEQNDAEACAELQEARKEIATLKAGAKPAKPGKEARLPSQVMQAARLNETWRELGKRWGSPDHVLPKIKSWAANANDAEWIAATQLEHRAGLEWPDCLRPAERAELLEGIREALVESAKAEAPAVRPDPIELARGLGRTHKQVDSKNAVREVAQACGGLSAKEAAAVSRAYKEAFAEKTLAHPAPAAPTWPR